MRLHLSPSLFLLALNCLALSPVAQADPTLPEGYTLLPLRNPKMLAQTNGTTALKPPSNGTWSVLLNGTFFDDQFHAVGTLFRDGVRVSSGIIKARTRGAVAQLASGELKLCLQPDSVDLEDLQSACAPGESPIRNFMGGAAILISHAKALSSEAIFSVQHFDNGGQGLQAEQFRRTSHSAIGIASGHAYAIGMSSKTGAELQRDCLRAGITELVMLDGGSGFNFQTPTLVLGTHPSPTGWVDTISTED